MDEQKFDALQAQVRLLKKWFKITAFFSAFVVLLLCLSFVKKDNGFKDQVLRVRGLIVTDDKGVERVIIGAPLPDPPILGKRIDRGDKANGILLLDKDGNERSGYATFDKTNTVAITLDEAGRMVMNFSTGELGGPKLFMTDEYNNNFALGTTKGGPYIFMREKKAVGSKVLSIQADSSLNKGN
jgi:hypothetical protein